MSDKVKEIADLLSYCKEEIVRIETEKALAELESEVDETIEIPEHWRAKFEKMIAQEGNQSSVPDNVIHADFTPKTLFSYPLQNAASDQETPWYLKAPQIEWKDDDSGNNLTFRFSADAHSDNISVEVSAVGETDTEKQMIKALRESQRFGIYSGERLLASFSIEEDDFELGLFAEGKVQEKYASIGENLEFRTLP